ncbi:MAG: tRNA dihydrouridine synthase DusB [Candidatus Delongbacteria bacterium]|nr:tRNA dihydrouridine synthase DusB [Candidatus Delongbacteria bacterium]
MFDVKNFFSKRNIALAPMDGYTNIPFRLIIKEMKPDIMFTEFVNSDAVIYENKKTLMKIRILKEERPVAVQIFGKNPDNIAEAAVMLEEFEPDVIDLNFGCPAPKVSGHGSGSALLKDLPLVARICEKVVKSVKTPVSAKTRLGWDDKTINIFQTAKIFEESGISFMTLHPRTRAQKFSGLSDWSYIKELKSHLNIPLFGNGDIITAEDAVRMFETTGCDGVMIGREAVKNPWIFSQIRELLEYGKYRKEIPLTERKRLCLKHFELSVEYLGDVKGVLEMRKLYQNYFKGLQNLKSFKKRVFAMTDPVGIKKIIEDFE